MWRYSHPGVRALFLVFILKSTRGCTTQSSTIAKKTWVQRLKHVGQHRIEVGRHVCGPLVKQKKRQRHKHHNFQSKYFKDMKSTATNNSHPPPIINRQPLTTNHHAIINNCHQTTKPPTTNILQKQTWISTSNSRTRLVRQS